MRKTKKQGRLTTNGVILQLHEQRTVNFLLAHGFEIELIKPSSKPNSKNSDFKMTGETWEMKCPIGKGKYIIRDTIRAALRQSPNIVLDLHRIKLNQDKALKDAQKYFFEAKKAKRLLVITQNQLLDFNKEV